MPHPDSDRTPSAGRWGLVGLFIYLIVLIFATIGELWEIDWILDLFSF